MKRIALGLGVLGLALSGCQSGSDATPYEPIRKATSPLLDEAALDRSVSPCDDFYRFSCGGWLNSFHLPSDRSGYVKQSSGLEDAAQGTIRQALESELPNLKQMDPSTPEAKAAGLYQTCLNAQPDPTEQTELVKAKLRTITVGSAKETAETVARLHAMGARVLFAFGSWVDSENSSQQRAGLNPSGFALPNRDFYLNEDSEMAKTRAAYVEHIAQILTIAGGLSDTDAAAQAAVVLKVETDLARGTLTPEQEASHPELMVHPTKFSDLLTLGGGFDWKTYFAAIGAPAFETLNVAEPAALEAMGQVLTTTSAADLGVYFRWSLLHTMAGWTQGRLEKENFHFWNQILGGQDQPEPRWKVCVDTVQSAVPEAVGKIYVERTPNAEKIRTQVETLMKRVVDSFGTNLDRLEWIDDATKTRAREKLAQVVSNVGFPERWKDYLGLAIDPKSPVLLEQGLALADFSLKQDLAKIGKATDRHEWEMGMWEANAYYSDTNNSMNFPLGSLVPPIYDADSSDGLNYGSFGASWVGHELTHGFDSGGRRFDAHGNLNDWWTAGTAAGFEARTTCLKEQASAYEVLPGVRVNGALTITENTADQGGMTIGWEAYQKAKAGRAPAAPIAGFNEDQQFFVAYAQGWCAKRTDASLRRLLASNSHPPEEFRVNGVVMNSQAFAETFGCKAGARMAPVNRCSVW